MWNKKEVVSQATLGAGNVVFEISIDLLGLEPLGFPTIPAELFFAWGGAGCKFEYMSMSEVVTIKISGELGERLRALSDQTHRTKAFYAREALRRQIDDLEDYYLSSQVAQQVHTGIEGVEEWDDFRREIIAATKAAIA